MTLYVRTPELVAEARRRMMHRMLANSFTPERTLSFPMNMKANKDEYTITAFLPGLTTDEIDIQFNNGVLNIEGEYKEIHNEDFESLLSEIPVGKFSRSVEINEPVVTDKIEAAIKNGVLTIRIPKAEEAKPKNIKIIAR